MRQIDADALAEAFSELEADNRKAFSFTRAADFRKASALTNIAPTIGLSMQWIPCSELMPEDRKSVLVYMPFFELITIATWYGSAWFLQSKNRKALKDAITHWMPLPEPPDGGDTVETA